MLTFGRVDQSRVSACANCQTPQNSKATSASRQRRLKLRARIRNSISKPLPSRDEALIARSTDDEGLPETDQIATMEERRS